MEICSYNECTACYACVNACPVNCISMRADQYGELHPYIDCDKCIKCHKCVKSCPNNSELVFRLPQQCIAAWITDKSERAKCASGGIGTLLSQYVITEKRGVVFGTKYNDNLVAVTSKATTIEDLALFKGSKYVISDIGTTYREIKKCLLNEQFVLYIATPCQISGLNTFLGKEYDNLITTDLICHGVCPSSYLTGEINFLKERHNIKEVTECRFRGNDENNFVFTLWDGNEMKYKKRASMQYYFKGFLSGVTLRNNCNNCRYARPERVSDITLGDFIGLGNLEPFPQKEQNTSSIFINTNKGAQIVNEIRATDDECKFIDRKLEERLLYKPSLLYPFSKHELKDTFRLYYAQYGYVQAIRMTLRDDITRAKRQYILGLWKFPLRVMRKVYRIIIARIQ